MGTRKTRAYATRDNNTTSISKEINENPTREDKPQENSRSGRNHTANKYTSIPYANKTTTSIHIPKAGTTHNIHTTSTDRDKQTFKNKQTRNILNPYIITPPLKY